MTCPHDNISLPTTSDPQTVCADCGQVLEPWEVRICEPCQIPKNSAEYR